MATRIFGANKPPRVPSPSPTVAVEEARLREVEGGSTRTGGCDPGGPAERTATEGAVAPAAGPRAWRHAARSFFAAFVRSACEGEGGGWEAEEEEERYRGARTKGERAIHSKAQQQDQAVAEEEQQAPGGANNNTRHTQNASNAHTTQATHTHLVELSQLRQAQALHSGPLHLHNVIPTPGQQKALGCLVHTQTSG